MAKRAQLPDGTILEFPDETPDAVMDGAVRSHLAQSASAPDFSNVQSSMERAPDVAATQARLDARARPGGSPSLVGRAARSLGGRPLEEGVIGVGKSIDTALRGSRQLLTDSLSRHTGMAATGLQSIGLEDAAGSLTRNIGIPLARSSQRQMEEEAAIREADEIGGLNRSTAATVGNIAGTVGQIIGPGAALRGTMAGRALLPQTIRGNMLLGAGVGAMQPVAEEGERGRNVAVGALASAAGSAIPKIAGSLYSGGRALVEPFYRAGQERIAGRLLQQSAVTPSALGTAAPSMIPGVQRTLAQETLDPGIAQLERLFPVQMAEQASRGNAARVQAVRETFQGADQASIDAIEAARNEAAERAIGGLQGITNPPTVPAAAPQFNPFAGLGVSMAPPPPAVALPKVVDLDPVDRALTGLIEKRAFRPAVKTALEYVQNLTRQPIRNAEEAYDIRKTIGDLMEGKIGGDQASSKVARDELIKARDILDQQMAAAFPGWGKYLADYRAASRLADQARVGQRFIEGSGVPRGVDAATGEPLLTPAALTVGRNADRLTQAATGFPRATAAGTLDPPQANLLKQLAEEADRIRFSQNAGRAVGSNTRQNLATENILSRLSGGSRLGNMLTASQPMQRVVSLGEKTYGLFGVPERLQQVLLEALSDPRRARQIIAALPGPDQGLVTRALTQTLMRGGNIAPALSE